MTAAEPGVTKGLFVRFEAKPGREDELEKHLKSALAAILEEPDTIAWMAIRLGQTSYAVVDAFPDEAGRQFHLEAGKLRVGNDALAELFAQPPTFTYTDILAAKLPDAGDSELEKRFAEEAADHSGLFEEPGSV